VAVTVTMNGPSSLVLWSTSGLSTGGLLTGGRVVVVVVAAGVVVGGDVVEVGATVVGGDVVEVAGMVVVTGAWVVMDRDVTDTGAMVVVVVLDGGARVVGCSCVDVTASGFELQPPAPATSSRTSAIRKQRRAPPPPYLHRTPLHGWHPRSFRPVSSPFEMCCHVRVVYERPGGRSVARLWYVG